MYINTGHDGGHRKIAYKPIYFHCSDLMLTYTGAGVFPAGIMIITTIRAA